MQLSFTQKKHIRKNFGKLVEGLSIPNLIEVQKNSYTEFLKSKSLNDQINDLSKGIDKVFVYGSYNSGIVPPGDYKIKMNIGGKEYQNSFFIESDPNFEFKLSEYLEQEELLLSIEENIRDLNMAVAKARRIKVQLENDIKKMDKKEELSDLIEMAKKITFKIDEWEQKLIQPKQKTFQDVINFHNKLNAEFIYLHEYVNSLDPKVTSVAKERFKDLDYKFKMNM